MLGFGGWALGLGFGQLAAAKLRATAAGPDADTGLIKAARREPHDDPAEREQSATTGAGAEKFTAGLHGGGYGAGGSFLSKVKTNEAGQIPS